MEIYYIFIAYWLISFIVVYCIRLYNYGIEEIFNFKMIILAIFLTPFMGPFLLINYFKELFEKIIKEHREKIKKEKIGLLPNEEYLTFSRICGSGIISCRDCGHEEEIICFVHGANSCKIGRQCPHCHTFTTEYNESDRYHRFAKTNEDFKCPSCGKVIRKKEDAMLKGNDSPLLCPKCNSARLDYTTNYVN